MAAATPTITLSSTSTPTLGGSVTFTATVTGVSTAVAPAGVMSFAISGTGGASSCNTSTGPISTGATSTYTCTVLTPHAGTYIATATMAADSNYTSVTSSSDTLTLAATAPVITLAASSNPVLNSPVTLTTTITGIAGAVQPTGAVSWSITDPNNNPVTCTNPTGPTAISSNVSTYTCTFTPTIASTYHITSTIAADGNYLTATSSILAVNLASATPTITVVDSPSSPTLGQPLTFTAVVTGVGPNPAPTGSLTWTISGAATSCTSVTGPVEGALTATYTCQIATPVTGTYSASATYNGDSNYSSLAPTATYSLTVAKATPSIAITTSPASPIFGGTITYTATITGVVGASAPAGTLIGLSQGLPPAAPPPPDRWQAHQPTSLSIPAPSPPTQRAAIAQLRPITVIATTPR